MLLELSLGVLAGFFFLRAGLPSIFPLLIWLSVLGNHSSVWLVLGIASASVVGGWRDSDSSLREDMFIGFFSAAAALMVFALFFSKGIFDGIIAPLLVVAVGIWLLISLYHSPRDALGGFILLGAGWWLLHERVIPAVLPSFFSGWWGVDWFHHSIYARHSLGQKIRDAFIGCASGLLPGLGPGLVNVLWMSGRGSLSMGVSNLVFSIGLLAQNGSIRSAVAAELGNVSSIPWFVLIILLGIGFLLAFFLSESFSFDFIILPSSAWFVFQVVGIFWVGGFLACGVLLASYALRRVFLEWKISLHTGMLLLIPSIVWFYLP